MTAAPAPAAAFRPDEPLRGIALMVAAMAVFRASDRAANVTGQTINVDGGYVMR